MKELLQELWDEYRVLIKDIDKLTEDDNLDEKTVDCINAITGDTEKMAELRSKLFDAGVQNIPGFDYET